MKSKLRVRIALNHEEPDRVPASLSASPWVVERLEDYLGVETDRELLEALHIDVFDMRGIDYRGAVSPRYVGPEDLGVPRDWNGAVLALFGYRETVVDTDYGKMYSQGEARLSEAKGIEDLQDYPWPSPDWFDYSVVSEQLDAWSDFAIACTGCSVFQHPTFLRGMDKLLLDMARAPDMAEFVFDRFTDFYYEYYRRIFENAGGLIDIFRIADDLGTQDSLLISPAMIERFFAPRLKRFADLAGAYGIKLLFHCDGSIRRIVPRLIELGVDILDPIQPEAKDMDPAEIKQAFGDRLCLQGGISAQDVLSGGTVENVEEEVKRRIDQLAPGGGYILSPGHPVLQVDVPVENIVAMYQTGFEYGKY